jgi:hypothetical protein
VYNLGNKEFVKKHVFKCFDCFCAVNIGVWGEVGTKGLAGFFYLFF